MLTPGPISPVGSALLSLPQGATGGQSAPSLPLPGGTLVPAKILQSDHGVATLLLGNIKLQVKLPSQMPSGQLWVLVMDNGNPPKLRLLSESQAANMLATRLAEAAETNAQKQTAQLLKQQEWPLQQAAQGHQNTYLLNPSGNGQMLFVQNADDQSTQGMIERDSDEDGFTLHGRVDLENLGRLYFALRKAGELPLQLDLRAADHASFMQLQGPFSEWIQTLTEADSEHAMKAVLSEGDHPVVRSIRQSGTMA